MSDRSVCILLPIIAHVCIESTIFTQHNNGHIIIQGNWVLARHRPPQSAFSKSKGKTHAQNTETSGPM